MTRPKLGSAGRGFAYILGGSVGAQLVALAVLPLLSRLYTPSEYGYFTLVLALAALVAPAATLRFESAAMLPDRIDHVRALVWNALLAAATIALAYAGLLHLLINLGSSDLAAYPIVPVWAFVTVMLSATYAIFSQLSLRKQQYALVARRSLLRSIVTACTQTGLALVGRTPDGLIIGATIGSAVGIGSMVSRTREFLPFPGTSALKDVWRLYWRFPAVFAPSAILNSIGLQAPLLFFTAWYGLSVGGQLGMAERIVAVPLAVIGSAVGQTVDAEVSKRIREGARNLLRGYLRLSAMLGVLGAVIAIGFTLLGAVVIPWVLGDQWVLAGQIVQVLALTSGIRIVASPLSRYLLLLQKSLANSILDVVRVALMVAAIVLVVTLHVDLLPALWLMYSGLSLTYLITWIYGAILVSNRDRSMGTARLRESDQFD